jgi:hypothetical protein
MYQETKITHPTVTSKMLLPTEEDTAMSPKPFLATITLVMRSGMEVPAARNVNPITCNMTDVATFIHANYGGGKF